MSGIKPNPDLPEGFPEPECWSGVGKGWFSIVENCHKALLEIDPNYIVSQVKEKFGTLSYYASPSEEAKEKGIRYEQLAPPIREAGQLSAITCELCGEPGELRKEKFWRVTRCDSCNAKRLVGQ